MLGNTLLIVNPSAQSGKARKTLHEVSGLLEGVTNSSAGHYYEIIETTYPLDAVIISHELGEHFDTVFVLGGDGVVHEVINGLMQLPSDKRPNFGILPAGQGNDFARSLNLPLNPMKVIDQLPLLTPRTVDVGVVNNTYFAETLSFGVDAAIALETMERRQKTKRTGPILYLESGFNQIKNHLDPIDAEITIDGKDLGAISFYTFAIQNGITYGGGFKICPDAKLDDGLFNICYASAPLTRFEAVKVFMRAKQGKHVGHDNVHFLLGKDITLHFDQIVPAQIDGEPISAYDYRISIEPGALKVLSL